MTHRHRKFWREKGSNKIFSNCYCGVDIHMDHIEDGKQWQYRDFLSRGIFSAMTAYSQRKEDYASTTIHPEVVMDITGEASDCEECEAIYGLKVLADV